ncbi:DUF1800 family protein [Winogradskyella sp.]|uniref:DUF1800 family protein n=1 Tax=Winogradskyella sp. TaxID=1883156 RepID=UPI0025F79963|nr:DUF1800 family protein [Winogradskyella sp.]
MVGLSRTVPVNYANKRALYRLQKALGQTLLDPPNVAGWKGHKNWIDVNTIVVRLKLPSLLLNGGLIALDDGVDNMRRQFFNKNKIKLPLRTTPDWETFQRAYKNVSHHDLISVLLNGKMNSGTLTYLKSFDKSSKQNYCIQLMSLPEYQMC